MKLNKIITFSGIGLHSGKKTFVSIIPKKNGSGISFIRNGIETSAIAKNVTNTHMATTIGSGKGSISTIEHFMAACSLCKITDIQVSVSSEEFPIMDGSAIEFVKMFLDNCDDEDEPTRPQLKLKLLKKVSIKTESSSISAIPSDKAIFITKNKVRYIGVVRSLVCLDTSQSLERILSSRTFGFFEDFEHLKSKGLAQGASLKNVLVLDGSGRLKNPFGYRNHEELANHKLLDMIGDFALLGFPRFEAAISSINGGHSLNNQLARKILSDKSNYQIINSNS